MTGLFLLAFMRPGFAQHHGNSEIGFTIGPSWSSVYGNPFIETYLERSSGFTGGPALYYNFRRHWAIRSNILIEKKGASGMMPFFDREGNFLGFFDTEVKYRYITVPLLFDYYFGRKLEGHLTGGAYTGLMLSQSTTYKDPQTGFTKEERGTAEYRPWDSGISLGFGARYNYKPRFTLSLETRFNFGITNIVSRPVLGSLTIYNTTGMVLLGAYYKPGYIFKKLRGKR